MKHFVASCAIVLALLLNGCGDGDNSGFPMTPVVSQGGNFLYVNANSAPNYVSGYAISTDGTLAPLPGSPFATLGKGSGGGFYAASPIAIARTKKLLFAANKRSDSITVFALNPNNGGLSTIGAPVASGGRMGRGGSLLVSGDENFLFVANEFTQNISVFTISTDGTLTPVPGSPFGLPAGLDVDGITLNAAGNILYAAGPTSNALEVRRVAADGSLTPIAGSPFGNMTDGNITSINFAGPTLAVSCAALGPVASYSLDATGAPTLLHSLTVGYHKQNVRSARNGRLVIASGGGENNISVIKVASDGTLTEVGGSPFAVAVASSGYTATHPNGTFLYAIEWSFLTNSQIEAFRMDQAGALTSIGTYPLAPSGVITPGFATDLVVY